MCERPLPILNGTRAISASKLAAGSLHGPTRRQTCNQHKQGLRAPAVAGTLPFFFVGYRVGSRPEAEVFYWLLVLGLLPTRFYVEREALLDQTSMKR